MAERTAYSELDALGGGGGGLGGWGGDGGGLGHVVFSPVPTTCTVDTYCHAAGSGPHMATLLFSESRVSRVRAAGQPDGTLPVSRLLARFNVLRAVSAVHAAGSVPVARLPSRLRLARPVRVDQDAGRVPVGGAARGWQWWEAVEELVIYLVCRRCAMLQWKR
jgi:hypothetical protein